MNVRGMNAVTHWTHLELARHLREYLSRAETLAKELNTRGYSVWVVSGGRYAPGMTMGEGVTVTIEKMVKL